MTQREHKHVPQPKKQRVVVRVSQLRPGDRLVATNRTVVSVRPARGRKCQVIVRDNPPRAERCYSARWNASTSMRVERVATLADRESWRTKFQQPTTAISFDV